MYNIIFPSADICRIGPGSKNHYIPIANHPYNIICHYIDVFIEISTEYRVSYSVPLRFAGKLLLISEGFLIIAVPRGSALQSLVNTGC